MYGSAPALTDFRSRITIAQATLSLLFLGVFVSLFFLAVKFLGLLGRVCLVPGFLRVRKVREILGVFEVFLGIFAMTREKKDGVQTLCPC